MPKKTKKELEKLKKEKEEMDDRIAQLKLLVAEKKKKEQSKGVASNLKEEILKKKKAKAQEKIGFDRRFEVSDSKDWGDVNIRLYNDKLKNELKAEIIRKKKAKAQEKISKARKLDAGIAKHMRDYNLKYYISNKDTEGKELKKQQEKQQKKQVAKKEDDKDIEVYKVSSIKDYTKQEVKDFKKEAYNLLKKLYFSVKKLERDTPTQIVKDVYKIFREEQKPFFWTNPELNDIFTTFKQTRKKEDKRREFQKEQDKKTILSLRSEIVGRKKEKTEKKKRDEEAKILRLKNRGKIRQEEVLEKKEREEGDKKRQQYLDRKFRQKQEKLVNTQIQNDFNNKFKQYGITHLYDLDAKYKFLKELQTGKVFEFSRLDRYENGSLNRKWEHTDAPYPLINREDIDRSIEEEHKKEALEMASKDLKKIMRDKENPEFWDDGTLRGRGLQLYFAVDKKNGGGLPNPDYTTLTALYPKEYPNLISTGSIDKSRFWRGWIFIIDRIKAGKERTYEAVFDDRVFDLFTDTYTFKNGKELPFLYKDTIDRIVEILEPEYLRIQKILNRKREQKRRVFESDLEYDTESTVESDLSDYDSDFEGRLDREDKPLKQGRLTVVDDKPRVFIDDKSFLF